MINMETKRRFFEDANGNKSSSRVIGFSAIVYALLQSTLILVFGHLEGASVIATSAASSANFLAIAGPSMIYMFQQKRTEEIKK